MKFGLLNTFTLILFTFIFKIFVFKELIHVVPILNKISIHMGCISIWYRIWILIFIIFWLLSFSFHLLRLRHCCLTCNKKQKINKRLKIRIRDLWICKNWNFIYLLEGLVSNIWIVLKKWKIFYNCCKIFLKAIMCFFELCRYWYQI